MGVRSVVILKIKQAECALADKRLDEAFELASDAAVRLHRDGQRLIGQLTKALVQRGQAHLAADRHTEALADCDKAGRCGGNLPEVAQLRLAITQALAGQQHAQQQQAEALATVRRHLDNGRLSMGEQALADLDSDSPRREPLERELAARRTAVDSALARVQLAVEQADWDTAINELLNARRAQAPSPRVLEWGVKLTTLVTQHIRQAIHQGRIDQARMWLHRLAPLADRSASTEELARILQQCGRAIEAIQQGQPRQAGLILQQLAAVVPEAPWIEAALGQARQVADNLEALHAGPLGLLTFANAAPLDQPGPHAPPPGPALDAAWPGPAVVPQREDDSALPKRFVMQVDGVGSFLVFRQGRITIGPVSSSRQTDLGLMADPSLPVATIERVDEDYFLRCERPIMVNGKPATSKLLINGDEIALSARCRLRFSVPNAASTTAILLLSGTRLPQTDARRIILLDRDMIVGPGPAAHVRADQSPETTVLHLRAGRLVCRTFADGIPLGVPVQIGAVSLVLTAG